MGKYLIQSSIKTINHRNTFNKKSIELILRKSLKLNTDTKTEQTGNYIIF